MNSHTTMTFQDIQAKVDAARKSGVDLSMEEDLSIAIMNLVSLEEHFFFTGAKTSKPEYYDLLGEVREMRKELLGRMIEKTEGETWCISKHLLATSMRLLEVGTKLQSDGKKDEAEKMFKMAHKAHSLFFALRLKLIDAPTAVKTVVAEKPEAMSVSDIMGKLVDCCRE